MTMFKAQGAHGSHGTLCPLVFQLLELDKTYHRQNTPLMQVVTCIPLNHERELK